jgi:hypothetical protein
MTRLHGKLRVPATRNPSGERRLSPPVSLTSHRQFGFGASGGVGRKSRARSAARANARRASVAVIAAWNVGIDEAQRRRRKVHCLRKHGLALDLGLSAAGKASRRAASSSARLGSGSGAVKDCAFSRHAPHGRRRVAHVEPLLVERWFTMRHLMMCCRARLLLRHRHSAFPARKVA